MSIAPLNIGSAPNDGTGQNLRSGGQVINANFAELDQRTTAAQSAAEGAQAKADAAIPGSQKGQPNGVAGLDGNGTVPASQLPSYVDDVLEFNSFATLPATGETGKIYITIDTNSQYRWSGAQYVLLTASPGSTDAVPEGAVNKYWTLARTLGSVLTGLVTTSPAVIAATDTVLAAFGKLQRQITDLAASKASKGANNDITSLAGLTTPLSKAQGGTGSPDGIPVMVGATSATAGTPGLVPAGSAGDQEKFLTAGGLFKEPGGSGIPVGSLAPWSVSRTTLPAGWIARDGQVLNRADWPDLWALVSASSVTDAVWLASPYTSRGRYSSGDGSTTFRMPDTNGKHADGNTIAAMILRGDGKNSAGTAGLHQQDQLQNITGSMSDGGNAAVQQASGAAGAFAFGPGTTTSRPSPASATGYPWNFDASRVARTGTETRASNETVIWCTVGAGKSVNPGSVDVTALATTVSNQSSQIQAFDASVGFAYVYPNGGTEASPAVVAVSTQYTNPNPFPGHPVICEAQVLHAGEWVSPGWYGNNSSASGVRSAQGVDAIRTSTGLGSLLIGYQWGGGSTSSNTGSGVSSLPCRVRVWRVKA